MNKQPVLQVRNVAKSYAIGKTTLEVLRDINWQIHAGEWCALLGASGSGKTTLLNLLGALERPDRGVIEVSGENYARLTGRAAATFRNRKLGFVFQSYCLLPELTIVENAMLPGLLGGMSRAAAKAKAEELLTRMGLGQRLRHRPTELSGGEQQRASIARALINDPELLLADEPTGNLDAKTGGEILAIFSELRRAHPGRAMVIITHNPEIARQADTIVTLRDGELHAE